MKRTIFGIAVCAAFTAGPAVVAQNAQPPARSITQIRGDLYFVRGGSHNTVLLVTPDGIILGDPISTEIANWLKPELDRRFNKPVHYNLRDYR